MTITTLSRRLHLGTVLCLLFAPRLLGQTLPTELLAAVNRQHLRASWQLTLRLSQQGAAEASVDQILEVRWAAFQNRTATLAVLLEPTGLRGVSVLTRESAREGLDQTWVVLAPKTQRPFVVDDEWRGEGLLGSDFSHEDNQRLISPGEFHLKRVGKAACGKNTCVLIEGVPIKSRNYGKVVWWIEPRKREITRADYYTAGNERLKTFEVHEWVTDQGIAIPRLQSIQNHKTGSRTTMRLLRYKRVPQFSEPDFTPKQLTALALKVHGGMVAG